MTRPDISTLLDHEKGLRSLLVRLKDQSHRVDFQIQREAAISLVLRPYLDPITAQYLVPFPEEVEIAEGYLYADYLPTDSHPSLVEQVRDTITEHIPEEERQWLDPIRHSYLDLLKIVAFDEQSTPIHLKLQSLGDQQEFEVVYSEKSDIQKGHVLLTRLIRGQSSIYLSGPPLVLSSAMAQTLLTFIQELRRDIEFGTGNFALAEWPEFAKHYGYLFVWSVARLRGGAMAAADARVSYWNEAGQPFFYAIVVYEHHEFQKFAEGLKEWKQLSALLPPASQDRLIHPQHMWLQYEQDEQSESQIVARIILTPIQLTVETDTPGRLDTLKHQLASTFGFALHFRGETITAPRHSLPQIDLLADTYVPPSVTVSIEEEQKLLSTFLQDIYLEWAEQPSPALDGKTPRQYCRDTQDTTKVAKLIDQLEQNDLGRQRTGSLAYDYSILRAHIGL